MELDGAGEDLEEHVDVVDEEFLKEFGLLFVDFLLAVLAAEVVLHGRELITVGLFFATESAHGCVSHGTADMGKDEGGSSCPVMYVTVTHDLVIRVKHAREGRLLG